MIRCLHCGAETDNGLALCALCQRKARACLEFIPTYFRNLARWRPGRAGARPVPGSREPMRPAVGATDRVGRVLESTGNAVTTWARALVDDRPHLESLLDPGDRDEAEMVAWLCREFDQALTSISTLDWCGEWLTELERHESTLRWLTEQVVPGWYAGGCQRCDSGMYVVPGLTWVTCNGCGATTYARDRLDVVLDEARGWVARPKAIAEAIVALVDTEQSVARLYERIKKWSQRGRLEAVRALDEDGDEVGPKRFRLGDVVDLLLAEGETRATERMTA